MGEARQPEFASLGIEVDERDWAVVYEGTREALIASGLAKAGQFPGEPGCGKTSTVFPGEGDRRKIKVSIARVRAGKAIAFQVAVYRTKAEYEAHWEKWNAESEARRREYQAECDARLAASRRDLTQKALAEVGPRGIADAALKGALVGIMRAFNLTGDPDMPYTFDDETIGRAKYLGQRLLQLFEEGTLTPQLGAVAQGDADYQRFMGTVLNLGGTARE